MPATNTIRYVTGDATAPDRADGRPALIPHICNDIGAWGAGFVLALSARWEAPEHAYIDWSEVGSYPLTPAADIPFNLGRTQFVEAEPGITVANMIAQRGIAGMGDGVPIRYPALTLCLVAVRGWALDKGAHVHMPRIGAGLAGGDWSTIERLIETNLAAHNVPVTVYDLPARTGGAR